MKTKTLIVLTMCVLWLAYSAPAITVSQTSSLPNTALNVIGGPASSTGNYGYSVSARGDVNKDGVNDLIIGSYPTSGTGYVTVVFGVKGGLPTDTTIVANAAASSTGYRITAGTANDGTGSVVAFAGDVNGDGCGDILIGQPLAGTGGTVSVVYGVPSTTTPANLVLDSSFATATSKGFLVTTTTASIKLGSTVTYLGDLNGDNNYDFAVGAPAAGSGNGAVYVIMGVAQSGTPQSTVTVDTIGSKGISILDTASGNNEAIGSSLSYGDVNGDGVQDLLIGTAAALGKVYIWYGVTSPVNVPDISTQPAATTPPTPPTYVFIKGSLTTAFGFSVKGLGDLNGDTYEEIAISDPKANSNQGAVWIIFGKAKNTWTATAVDTTTNTDTSVAFKITGAATNDLLAYSVPRPFDVNGDGIIDFIFGEPLNSGTGGVVYVLYGNSGLGTTGYPSGGSISLTSLTPETGFTIGDDTASSKQPTTTTLAGPSSTGPAAPFAGNIKGDAFGFAITAGDVDGDKIQELVISAPQISHGTAGNYAGAVYVYHFGAAITNCLQAFNGQCLACKSGYYLDSTSSKCLAPTASVADLAFPANYPATALNVFGGNTAGAGYGYSIATGDVNGDQIDDIIIGSSSFGNNAGTVTVIYGQNVTFPQDNSAPTNAAYGYVLTGTTTDGTGTAVEFVGDVNMDYIGDFVIGAPGIDTAYVIFGVNGTKTTGFTLSAIAKQGIKVTGASGSQLGTSIAPLGDINGDKVDDYALGAPNAGTNNYGVVYVIYGVSGGTANIAAGTNSGYQITASASEQLGRVLDYADVNGDDLLDIIIGTNDNNVYVVFSTSTTPVNVGVSSLSGTTGFKVSNLGDTALKVTGLGDINGDKIDDFAISTQDAGATNRRYSGLVYVLYGTKSWSNLDVSQTWSQANGFIISGAAVKDYLGKGGQYTVMDIGDVNGDDLDDIAVSTSSNSGTLGTVYVIYGRKSSSAANIDLSTGLPYALGFEIQDSTVGKLAADVGFGISDAFGWAINVADIDKDGFDEILISAPQKTHSTFAQAGVVYAFHFNEELTGCSQAFNGSCLACQSGYTFSPKTGGCYVASAITTTIDVVVYDADLTTDDLLPITVESEGQPDVTIDSGTDIPYKDDDNTTITLSAFEIAYKSDNVYGISFDSGLPIISAWTLDTPVEDDNVVVVVPTGGQSVIVWFEDGTFGDQILYQTGDSYDFNGTLSCGTYIVDDDNDLLYFYLTGDEDCAVIVQQRRGAQGYAEYNQELAAFIAADNVDSFIDQLCTKLALPDGYCRASSATSGSTVVNFAVDAKNQSATNDDDLDTLVANINSALNNIKLTGATLISSSVSASVPISYHPSSTGEVKKSNHHRTVVLACCLAIILGTLFLVLMYVLISRYFKNRNQRLNNPNAKVTPGR